MYGWFLNFFPGFQVVFVNDCVKAVLRYLISHDVLEWSLMTGIF